MSPLDGSDRRPVGGGKVYIAASFGATVAHLGTSTMPFQVGALMDGAHMSASVAGAYGFCLICSLALTMFALAQVGWVLSPFKATTGGIVLTSAAFGSIGLFPQNTAVVCLLAVAAGIGLGFAFASFISKVATFANAARIYSIASGGSVIIIVGIMALMPIGSRYFGSMGSFLCLAGVLLCFIPFFAGYGPTSNVFEEYETPKLLRRDIVALLSLWSLLTLGAGAVWTFAERVGHSLALRPLTVAMVLSFGTLSGVAGSLLAAATAHRIPKINALVFGLLGTGTACILLATAGNLWIFAIAVQLYWLLYLYVYSCILGISAWLDPSGKAGVTGAGLERFGFAIGAPMGGLILDHFGFLALGVVSGLACSFLLPVCIPILRKSGLDQP